MKNDNRIFNNLQRAYSTEQNSEQSLSGRLISETGGISTPFVVDGLVPTGTASATVGISVGTVSITNPSPAAGEPAKLLLSLRTATTVAVPATGTWYTLSASVGSQTITTAPIDIYNPTTQTFSSVVSNVQAENNITFVMTAGTGTTFGAVPAGQVLIAYVFDSGGPTPVVFDSRPTMGSTIATPLPNPDAGDVFYEQNDIVQSVADTGIVSWYTSARCSLGVVRTESTAVTLSSILSTGVSLTNGTLYHLYLLFPSDKTLRFGDRVGVQVVSDIAPAAGARTASIVGRSIYPNGTGVYCGSFYYISGGAWARWTTHLNETEFHQDVYGGYVASAAAQSTYSAATSYSGTLPPAREVGISGALGYTANNTASVGSWFKYNWVPTAGSGAFSILNKQQIIAYEFTSSGLGTTQFGESTPTVWMPPAGASITVSGAIDAIGTCTFWLYTYVRGVRF